MFSGKYSGFAGVCRQSTKYLSCTAAANSTKPVVSVDNVVVKKTWVTTKPIVSADNVVVEKTLDTAKPIVSDNFVVKKLWEKKDNEEKTSIGDGVKVPVHKFGPKKKNDFRPLKNAEHISKKINVSVNSFNALGVFEAFEIARKSRIALTMKDYMGVLWACENIDISNNNHANIIKCKHAYVVYNIFKKEKNIPTDVFVKMMKVCAKLGHSATASMLLREFTFYGYKPSDAMTQDYVIAMARAAKNTTLSINRQDPQDIIEARANFVDAVELYARKSETEKWTGTAHFFAEIALTFSLINDEQRVLETLNRMTDLEHEPSRSFCAELFGSSLRNGDTLVLFTLCNWYLDNFSDAMVEIGALERLMHVSSATGNVQLAKLGFRLYKQCGYPITAQEYVCLINAALILRDFPSVMSAMQEAEAENVDILNCPDVQSMALAEYMVKILSQSMKQLDDIYFGLVSLIRENQKVPPLALSIVIRSSGRMGNIDRAFATFQECYSLFALPKDIHMFNALLFAIAKSYNPILLNMLTVFQNMENAQVSPNGESFSILFEVMAELGDMQGCEDLIQHMNSLNVSASDRSLRRLCFKYAATHEPLGLMMILDIMREAYRKNVGTTTLLMNSLPVSSANPLHVSHFASPGSSSVAVASDAALKMTGVVEDAADGAAPFEHMDDVFFTEEDDSTIFPVYFRKRVLYLMNNPIIPFTGKNHLPSIEERPLPLSSKPNWPLNRHVNR